MKYIYFCRKTQGMQSRKELVELILSPLTSRPIKLENHFVVQFQPQRKYQMEGISTRATLYYDVYIQLHIDVLDKFLGPHTLVLDVETEILDMQLKSIDWGVVNYSEFIGQEILDNAFQDAIRNNNLNSKSYYHISTFYPQLAPNTPHPLLITLVGLETQIREMIDNKLKVINKSLKKDSEVDSYVSNLIDDVGNIDTTKFTFYNKYNYES